MDINDRLAAKEPLFARVARIFIAREGWIEQDDAVQIVRLAAWRVIEQHAGVDDVDGLIARIGLRRLYDELRSGRVNGVTRANRRGGGTSPVSLNITSAPGGDEWLTNVAGADGYTTSEAGRDLDLGRAMQHLSDRERFVIWARYFEGLSLREIGELLGVCESRISQVITKAQARMRPLLAA